ncbi:MAG: SUMF1/EgtB/PvdO family nonheme iron enzyme [Bacteroidota bacterium]
MSQSEEKAYTDFLTKHPDLVPEAKIYEKMIKGIQKYGLVQKMNKWERRIKIINYLRYLSGVMSVLLLILLATFLYSPDFSENSIEDESVVSVSGRMVYMDSIQGAESESFVTDSMWGNPNSPIETKSILSISVDNATDRQSMNKWDIKLTQIELLQAMYFQQASRYYKLGEYDSAFKFARKSLAQMPKPDVLALLDTLRSISKKPSIASEENKINTLDNLKSGLALDIQQLLDIGANRLAVEMLESLQKIRDSNSSSGDFTSHQYIQDFVHKYEMLNSTEDDFLDFLSLQAKNQMEESVRFFRDSTIKIGKDDSGENHNHAHFRRVPQFELSRFEVTISQFCFFLNQIHRIEDMQGHPYFSPAILDSLIQKDSSGTYYPMDGKANYPIEAISWYAASDCASFFGGRLPSELEWEYAAKVGGIDTIPHILKIFSVDKAIRDRAGLYGMRGNVREWCVEWLGPYEVKRGIRVNPSGPDSGKYKVLRSGFNLANGGKQGSFHRAGGTPDYCFWKNGFRIAYN